MLSLLFSYLENGPLTAAISALVAYETPPSIDVSAPHIADARLSSYGIPIRINKEPILA